MVRELSTEEIEDILKGQLYGRIGCSADGVAYVVPVSYVFDGSWIYGHTYEGMKTGIMRKNPEVCLQVDIVNNMVNWVSVIAWGNYEEITDAGEREDVAARLITRRIPEMNIGNLPSMKGQQTIIYRISITKMTGRSQSSKP